MKKKIAVFLFDGFSDWEIAFLTPEIKKSTNFEIMYFSKKAAPVLSMGGLNVHPDVSLEEINLHEPDVLVLPGGTAWEQDLNYEIDAFAGSMFKKGKTIAAICAASVYLAKQGFLNELKHTSNDLNYLKSLAPNYSGEQNYVHELAVTGDNVITANGIAPVEFAREVFAKIELYNSNELEKWFQLFKNGVWSE